MCCSQNRSEGDCVDCPATVQTLQEPGTIFGLPGALSTAGTAVLMDTLLVCIESAGHVVILQVQGYMIVLRQGGDYSAQSRQRGDTLCHAQSLQTLHHALLSAFAAVVNLLLPWS